MEELINFSKGPLFRFSFAIFSLGLLRLVALTIINGLEAKKLGRDKVIPVKYVRKLTWGFILPLRAFRVKPLYSIVSIIFHIGLILTPLLLFDHAQLIHNSIGFSWMSITLGKGIADILTIATIISAVILLIMRISNRNSRFISRKQDFIWPLLLIVPFISGLICAQFVVNPATYKFLMLIHIISGCLILMLIPFTKIAHCILLPFGQWITARAWKFTADGGEDVIISLGKEGEGV